MPPPPEFSPEFLFRLCPPSITRPIASSWACPNIRWALLKNGSLDALDFPQFTVDKFGIQAIDLWEGGLPKDKLDDAKYLQAMRKKAEQREPICSC